MSVEIKNEILKDETNHNLLLDRSFHSSVSNKIKLITLTKFNF
jgi:hypothetical protein